MSFPVSTGAKNDSCWWFSCWAGNVDSSSAEYACTARVLEMTWLRNWIRLLKVGLGGEYYKTVAPYILSFCMFDIICWYFEPLRFTYYQYAYLLFLLSSVLIACVKQKHSRKILLRLSLQTLNHGILSFLWISFSLSWQFRLKINGRTILSIDNSRFLFCYRKSWYVCDN